MGVLTSSLLAVRMRNAEDGLGYEVSINGGPLQDPFAEANPLRGIFEKAVQVQLFQPTALATSALKAELTKLNFVNQTKTPNAYGLLAESLRHQFPSNFSEIRSYNQVSRGLAKAR